MSKRERKTIRPTTKIRRESPQERKQTRNKKPVRLVDVAPAWKSRASLVSHLQVGIVNSQYGSDCFFQAVSRILEAFRLVRGDRRTRLSKPPLPLCFYEQKSAYDLRLFSVDTITCATVDRRLLEEKRAPHPRSSHLILDSIGRLPSKSKRVNALRHFMMSPTYMGGTYLLHHLVHTVATPPPPPPPPPPTIPATVSRLSSSRRVTRSSTAQQHWPPPATLLAFIVFQANGKLFPYFFLPTGGLDYWSNLWIGMLYHHSIPTTSTLTRTDEFHWDVLLDHATGLPILPASHPLLEALLRSPE